MNTIKAKIIADSLSPEGHRLTSFVLTYPRFIHSEMMTHRCMSRNAASSRAIPFKKMIEMVKEDPFIPIAWQKDHKGMQGNEYLDGREEFFISEKETDFNSGEMLSGPQAAQELWLRGRDAAVEYASKLNEITGVTKQICNRMLEPYMWYTAIFTGTEWENFFALRAEGAAEIHIQDLAYKMLDAMNASTPTPLKEGEWHIPFGDKFNETRISEANDWENGFDADWTEEEIADMLSMVKVKIATARCARVSYLNFEGKDDYIADLKLHDRLSTMKHWSPFEHCAKVMTYNEYNTHINGVGMSYESYPAYSEVAFNDDCEKAGDHLGYSGNFRGFIQYRKMFQDENKKDPRMKTNE